MNRIETNMGFGWWLESRAGGHRAAAVQAYERGDLEQWVKLLSLADECDRIQAVFNAEMAG